MSIINLSVTPHNVISLAESSQQLIPVGERGDFHSTAETTAGLEHFLDSRKNQFQARSPKTCLEIGLKWLVNAAEEKLKENLSIISLYILNNTLDIPTTLKENLNHCLEIIAESENEDCIKSVESIAINEARQKSTSSQQKLSNLLQIFKAVDDSKEKKRIKEFGDCFLKIGLHR